MLFIVVDAGAIQGIGAPEVFERLLMISVVVQRLCEREVQVHLVDRR